MSILRTALPCLVIAGLLAACASAPQPAVVVPPPGAAPTRTAPATLPPIPTTAPPTQTPTSLPTLTPTVTLTPTPTPDPMTIAVMRARAYDGSDITVEQELDAGSNYHRYYAYYLSDGLKIYGLLTVPNGDPPEGGWPAIVFNHGYIPPTVYKTTERYIAYVDWLARAGYVVFRIDYRGHDRSEGRAAGAYGDPGYTVDVLNALASLKRYPTVNPAKIGMWGHSMGGFLTLRAMVIAPDVKAGVIWGGVVGDYNAMLYHWRRAGPAPTPNPTFRGWRNVWVQKYGPPADNPEFWNSVSANAYLADLSGPIQLHAATTDEEVPYEFSEMLAQQIQAAGKTGELYLYPGDNHNLSASFAAAMTRTIAFFDQYLK